ncbi:hypothetical protein [Sinorhizobium meliloti]|uniref:TIGR02646 family protein n=1 Tax=Rhizobium meliloti TaxID=382 RepID=A0AAW9TQK0_RHIML|nr:hypothetical protein [Sinorhizobium meliloti]MQW33440.1 hypothetical protein [Sinorhizobium meliloti]
MRHVDLEDLRLPDTWSAEARCATLAVLGGADASDFDEVWRDLKQRLMGLLHDKCWFCESPVTRSDNAVDHFRPKGRVSDATQPHTGYRWLTFASANFRFACTFCNSRRVDVENGTAGGKADRFPLLDENARVYEVDPAALDFDDLMATVRAERPAILDPCHYDDWRLLGCRREDGSPCPTNDDPLTRERVIKSIEIFHLDYDPTCKQRHTVAGTLLRAVRNAKDAFLVVDPNTLGSELRFQTLALEIKRMIAKRAPYSGEMRFLLRGQRSALHPWIQELLEDG